MVAVIEGKARGALWLLLAVGVVVASSLLALGPAPAMAKGRCGNPAQRPWCDTSLPAGRRADLLLGAMTPAERISLLGGDELTGVLGGEGTHTGTQDGIPRLGLPTIYLSDGPSGSRSGKATALPSPIALGASWDPEVSRLDARVVSDEVERKGNDIVFAPTVDVVRTPLAGRVFEAIGGEDPYLSTRMSVPWIEAAQRRGLIATVKHYAGNNQEGTGPDADQARPGNAAAVVGALAPIGNRTRIDARIDERTLNELYLPMFEAAVKHAHVGAVMCAYNRVNGPFACESRALLENVLRSRWGFRGMTIADYGAAHDTGASLTGGLDIEPWPARTYAPTAIDSALAAGEATMSDVDSRARNYLRALFAAGALDRPAFGGDIGAHRNARRSERVAEASMTLLKNDGLLPLRRARLDSIAVLGPGADTFLTGGGSSEIDPYFARTPLEGIRRLAGPGVEVRSADGSDRAGAVQLARDSDVAIVVAASYSTEGVDRTCLTLECPPAFGDQDALIRAVAGANPRTAVVIESGGPVLTPWRHRIGALLEAWYPGSGGGDAIARVLFGRVDARGRLPVTFPRRESDIPTAGDPAAYPGLADTVTYGEGLDVGYRHYEARGFAPAFAFGAGLSYTRFRFSSLRVHSRPHRGPVVSIEVTNVGRRSGDAVPQLYLSLPSRPTVPQPPKKLAGFERVTLVPGRSRRVRFGLTRRAFSFWDASRDRWRVVAGCGRALVGRSSVHTPLRAGINLGGRCAASR
jgi:beta-glucosidase